MFWFQRCNRYGSYRGDVYLFMAPFTPENFQQPSQIRKEYSSMYIDISLPSEFKNHPADCDSEFISIFACSDRGKYCTATNTTNSTFQVLSSVSNQSQWEHYMFLDLKFGSWVELEEEGCKQTRTQYSCSDSWQYLIGNMATPRGNTAKLETNFN